MDSWPGLSPFRRRPIYGGFAYLSAPRLVLGGNVRPPAERLPEHHGICPSVNEPTGFTTLPLFTNLSAPGGVYIQLVRQSLYLADLPLYHFYHF